MGIPAFDSNQVIPPHLGNPAADRSQLSPYPCTVTEFSQHFATSPERRTILRGLLDLRTRLFAAGVIWGFQWLGGSFCEDIERSESRPPKDLDVVTVMFPPPGTDLGAIVAADASLTDRNGVKLRHGIDHIYLNAAHNPITTVEMTRYWYGLFSHRRNNVWKGLLRVELNTAADDAAADVYLRSLP